MDKSFFFVRGFVRSGTNWVCNLLNLHPKVFCNGEYHFFRIKLGIDQAIKLDYCLMHQEIYKKELIYGFEETVKRCMTLNCRKSKVQCFGDRTAYGIEPIIIRNAPQFYIIRDIRDILVSYTYHLFRTDHKDDPFKNLPEMRNKKSIFRKDKTYFLNNRNKLFDDSGWVKELSKSWVNFIVENNNSIQNSKQLQTKVFVLRYEELHSNIERQRNRMYQFLGLDPTEAKKITKLTSPGFDNENFQSHYRKGQIGDWVGYFNDHTKEWIKEVAGKTIIDLGYEKNNSW